ncbi:MAG: hydroxyethylthiazole kinase [Clostridiales bacterium]|nr:hydroxyethylthiazole kinase [Clostridiales bacterium]
MSLLNENEKSRISFGECLTAVHEKTPLIHNITNYVTVNDVANALLACGGSPIMSDEPKDVYEITSICGGLNFNIGTLNERSIEAMMIAGSRAKELAHVILLDPVGAGASTLRTTTAQTIVEKIKPDVIRGNISEIKTLAKGSGTTKGVDADAADTVTEENLDEMVAFVKAFAEKTNAVIAITGAIDLVADADICYVIRNGRKEMSRITGTGCQLSSVATAYAVANPEHKVDAVAAAVCLMGLAGEIGWEKMQEGDGNSTYRNRIIDAIFNMDAKTLEAGAKYEIR